MAKNAKSTDSSPPRQASSGGSVTLHFAERDGQSPSSLLATPASPAVPEALNFFNASGTWVSAADVPLEIARQFGPPKFSPEQQAADPGSARTRVLKDVLPVGQWKAGIGDNGQPVFLTVDASFLQQVVESFRQASARGVNFNLGKTHGDPATGLIHPDDLITPIDQLVTDGQTLWAACYVTPAQAQYLANPARKVSAGLRRNWMDGYGNRYPVQLVHVAVTDLPVVPGQGPFLAMSNTDSAATDPGKGSGSGKGSATENTVIGTFNRCLTLLGLGELPADVTEENMLLVVNALLNTVKGQDSEDDGEDSGAAGSGQGGSQTLPPLNQAGGRMSADLANSGTPASATNLSNSTPGNPAPAVAPVPSIADLVATQNKILEFMTAQQTAIVNLSNAFTAAQGQRVVDAKAAYAKRLDELAAGGNINGEIHRAMMNVGESTGWNLSNLDPFSKLQAVDLANRGKQLGDSSPAPAPTSGNPAPTKEEQEAHFKTLFGNRAPRVAAS
jgi:hypothetical protein